VLKENSVKNVTPKPPTGSETWRCGSKKSNTEQDSAGKKQHPQVPVPPRMLPASRRGREKRGGEGTEPCRYPEAKAASGAAAVEVLRGPGKRADARLKQFRGFWPRRGSFIKLWLCHPLMSRNNFLVAEAPSEVPRAFVTPIAHSLVGDGGQKEIDQLALLLRKDLTPPIPCSGLAPPQLSGTPANRLADRCCRDI